MAVITAAEARLLVPSLKGTTEDTNLNTYISRAESMLAGWLGFGATAAGGAPTLEDVTYTRYYEGDLGGDTLTLGIQPVASVTSIHDDPDWSYGANQLVASSDYTLDGETGIVHLNPLGGHGGFSTQKRAIKAVFVAGFATIPEHVKQAVAMQTAHLWRLRKEQGRESTSGAGGGALRAETIPDAVIQILNGDVCIDGVAFG